MVTTGSQLTVFTINSRSAKNGNKTVQFRSLVTTVVNLISWYVSTNSCDCALYFYDWCPSKGLRVAFSSQYITIRKIFD